MNFTAYYPSPIGLLEIKADEEAITSLVFVEKAESPQVVSPLLEQCMAQLAAYFEGTLTSFQLPIRQAGTAFQQQVWHCLMQIPYAATRSYHQLSCAIGNEKSIRAVGTANGRNKICIIVPCHRVIGADGKLTGYAGGLWRKQWLLEHEQQFGRGVLRLF